MADIRSKVYELYSLEQLSSNDSVIHGVHPLVKMASTLVYIVCIVSFDRLALFNLTPYIFYPVIALSLAEIPYAMILKRVWIALPFCLFAGLSNVLLETSTVAMIGYIAVSAGVMSLLAMVFRTLLCVSAVLILVAVTPFAELTGQMRRLHIPNILVSLFEMTYRYIGTLLSEAFSMFTAYKLRSNHKGLEMRYMGSFVGQLFIRSFDRAERIYHAMKCRGYPAAVTYLKHRGSKMADVLFFIAVAGSSILFRMVDVLGLVFQWLGGVVS